MSITVKDITSSRKTFFIAPDDSFFPESYLEDYFSLGYECYFIENDKKMIVTKGIGNSILPVRFNCTPEIVVINFE